MVEEKQPLLRCGEIDFPTGSYIFCTGWLIFVVVDVELIRPNTAICKRACAHTQFLVAFFLSLIKGDYYHITLYRYLCVDNICWTRPHSLKLTSLTLYVCIKWNLHPVPCYIMTNWEYELMWFIFAN